MDIKNILELEEKNQQIILHKEGLFVRAYERSAYLFTKHIKVYKLTKKFYKNVKQDVVYIGFPQNIFSKIEAICKEQNLSIKEVNNQIQITGLPNFTEIDFLNWKAEISLTERESVAQSPQSLTGTDLIKKIKSFNLVNKTPIECQQFMVELQNELSG